MEVKIKGKRCGIGKGGNKKESEQRAAMQALRKLKTEEKNRKKDSKGGTSFGGIISQVRKRIKI